MSTSFGLTTHINPYYQKQELIIVHYVNMHNLDHIASADYAEQYQAFVNARLDQCQSIKCYNLVIPVIGQETKIEVLNIKELDSTLKVSLNDCIERLFAAKYMNKNVRAKIII